MATDLIDEQCLDTQPVTSKRHNLADILFTPLTAFCGLMALTLSAFLPPDGFEITVCWFRWCFGLPCPGCGLTRSITSISHLQFENAWRHHPFGLLIYAIFVANAVLLIIPKAMRVQFRNKISSHNWWMYPLYLAFVISFCGFGGIRLLVIMTSRL